MIGEPEISRDAAAAETSYDLIAIGGGVYGVTLALEAARRGLKPLLLEKNDFGSGVSGNSLRVVHGGLRYLQNLQMGRLRESVAERRWHLENFPELVAPLSCVMPFYGGLMQRPGVFRVAALLNDMASWDRNRGLARDRKIGRAGVLGPRQTVERFPAVDQEGLLGAGRWFDAVMLSAERVLMETLRWACACGAHALNYAETVALTTDTGRVSGVEAVDRQSGATLRFKAPVVINCAGPWCRELAQRLDRDEPTLYRKSLAFNLLLDRESLCDSAVAVKPKYPGARTYFLLPWKGRVFAGTYHMTFDGHPDDQTPPEDAIQRFVEDLNHAIPNFGLSSGEILRVYSGMLPALRDGEPDMAHFPVVFDHGKNGGPAGLLSVSGVKGTTARAVSAGVIAAGTRANGSWASDSKRPGKQRGELGLCDATQLLADPQAFREVIQRIIRQEAVVYLDDLLLRRMDGLYEPGPILEAARLASEVMGLEGPEQAAAFARLGRELQRCRVPAAGPVLKQMRSLGGVQIEDGDRPA